MRAKPPELAKIVGRSTVQVYNWIKEGCPRNEDGTLEVPEVIDWLVQRNAGRTSAMEQKTRLTRAQADKAELQAARLRSDLVPVEEVQLVWNRMLGAFRARALALPTRVAVQTAAAQPSFEEHRQILDDAVYEFLAELANYEPSRDIPGTDAEHPETTAAPKRKRVGRSGTGAQSGSKRGAGKVADRKSSVSKGNTRRVQRPAGRTRGRDERGAGRKNRNTQ